MAKKKTPRPVEIWSNDKGDMLKIYERYDDGKILMELCGPLGEDKGYYDQTLINNIITILQLEEVENV